MDQVIKANWVAELKSGRYKQGRLYLRTANDEFCCLGVLCDMAVKAGVLPAPKHGNDDDTMEYYYGSRSRYLPDEVFRWAKLPNSSPECGGTSLAERNDSGETFEEIADCIEANL